MRCVPDLARLAFFAWLQLLLTGCEPSLPVRNGKPEEQSPHATYSNTENRDRIGIYFEDFHGNDRAEAARVAGHRLEIDPSLRSVFQVIEQEMPKALFIDVGINPHPEIRERIESLCRYCRESGIQYETSEAVYFILGGKLKGQ